MVRIHVGQPIPISRSQISGAVRASSRYAPPKPKLEPGMVESSGLAKLAREDVSWPPGWNAACAGEELRIELSRSKTDQVVASVCAVLLATCLLASFLFGGPYGDFHPSWRGAASADRYAALAFNTLFLIVLGAAVWLLFGKTTYYFAPNSFVRRQQLFGWFRVKTIVDATINLNVLYEHDDAREESVWSWDLELRASEKSHLSVLKLEDATISPKYLSTALPREVGEVLSRITGWPFEIDLTRQDRPEPSTSTSS
jgi:hypothetical protein